MNARVMAILATALAFAGWSNAVAAIIPECPKTAQGLNPQGRRLGTTNTANEGNNGNRYAYGRNCDISGGGGGGGGTGTGLVGGTVRNDGAGAVAYPVTLLSSDGTTVVATATTTSDGSGSYMLSSVPAGTFLLCELAPDASLSEVMPSYGPACPSGYGPVGYWITLADGGISVGNAFSNVTP